jgi:hypothetical protein
MSDTDPGRERLDSWKAIADYLQRDVRTVRRWEKTLALPIRRVPGSRGHSVFAYVAEIETWLKTTPPAEAAGAAATVVTPDLPIDPPASADGQAGLPRRPHWRWPVAAAAVVLVVTGLAWVGRGSGSDADTLTVHVTPTAVVAVGAGGTERWRYPFSQEEPAVALPRRGTPEWLTSGKNANVLVGTSHRLRMGDNVVSSGQLLWLTAAGHLERTFSFDDRLAFGGGEYGAPWLIADFRVGPKDASLVAVAARHLEWWPSVVTVLDGQGTRRGTFVNAGWIDGLQWVAPDRLIIGGFSNLRDGGMIALLDANALDGQSPAPEDSTFRCKGCGAGVPLRYVTLPRSELNRVTGSRFNRVTLEPAGGRVVARTLEAEFTEQEGVEALYEFSPSLDLVHASYSDQYWRMHKALEAQGKLTHTRAQCPDRDGPRQIDVWEPRTGWKTITIAH